MEIYRQIIRLTDMETNEKLIYKVKTPLILLPEEIIPVELSGKVSGMTFYSIAREFLEICFRGEVNSPTEIGLYCEISCYRKGFNKFKRWKIDETRYIHFTVTYQKEKNFSFKDILEYRDRERANQFLKKRGLTICGGLILPQLFSKIRRLTSKNFSNFFLKKLLTN